MYCKHCGKEISGSAKFCDGCGKSVSEENFNISSMADQVSKKKKKKKHPILGAIVLVFGIFILIGAFGGSNDPEKVQNGAPASSTNAEETKPELFTVGDTLERNGVLITLNNVYESKGSQFFNPSEGNVFVVCEFTIENNTSSEMAISSMMSFEAYFDDYAANLSLGAMTADQSKQQLDGTVAPGKKINGVVGYEAPADWEELEIRFSPSAYSVKPFIFTYNK